MKSGFTYGASNRSGLGGYLLGAQDRRTGAPSTQDFSRFSFLLMSGRYMSVQIKTL
jgi:hypothetical protein